MLRWLEGQTPMDMQNSLLALDAQAFLGALDELGIEGEQRNFLLREKRKYDSALGGLMDFGATPEGQKRATILPMVYPEGMTGWDAITSGQAQLALPSFITGTVEGAARAIDLPRASLAGQIPPADMESEALNMAGMASLGAASTAGTGLFDYDPTVMRAGAGPKADKNKLQIEELQPDKLRALQEALARTRSNRQDVGVDFTMRGEDYFSAPREGAGRAKDPALFTPYSSLKETQTPPSDWIATGKDYVGTRGAPIMARPEDFHKRTLFGYTSDSTPTNRVIETLNGLEFENPVLQQGGQTFVDQEGRGFASEYVAMKTKQDAWNRAREAGADPLVTPLVMGPKSGDASQHLSQTMVQAIRANAANIDTSFVPKLPPKMAKDYAEIIDPSMGLLDPRLPSFLASRSGAERSAFVKAMDKSSAAKAGVPSAAAVRWATTDPQLMGAEMLSGGFRVFEPSSAPLMIDDPAGHATYNAIIGREGPNMTMGLQTRPWYLMFPDFAYDKMVASTPRGQNMLTMAAKPKDLRALQMNPNISQYIDQEWVDANSAYDEALRSKGKDAAYMAALDALVARAQRQGK